MQKNKKIYRGAIDTLMENSEISLQEFERMIGIIRE